MRYFHPFVGNGSKKQMQPSIREYACTKPSIVAPGIRPSRLPVWLQQNNVQSTIVGGQPAPIAWDWFSYCNKWRNYSQYLSDVPITFVIDHSKQWEPWPTCTWICPLSPWIVFYANVCDVFDVLFLPKIIFPWLLPATISKAGATGNCETFDVAILPLVIWNRPQVHNSTGVIRDNDVKLDYSHKRSLQLPKYTCGLNAVVPPQARWPIVVLS